MNYDDGRVVFVKKAKHNYRREKAVCNSRTREAYKQL